MHFASDNTANVCPEIMAALVACNDGAVASYGSDAITKRLHALYSRVFDREVVVFPVITGTAANALALSIYTPPYGKIYCHTDAHVQQDECGAPECFTGGAKLVSVAGEHGKINVTALEAALQKSHYLHGGKPSMLSLTQATEAGTLYSIQEIETLASLAHAHGLHVHMDGARFANALVTLGCSPADITWKVGVDVLCLGATKNGAMAAEAVIFFQPEHATDMAYRRKRVGHLLSKLRYVSAQLEAYVIDDVWLRNATHANRMATALAEGLMAFGFPPAYPVQANEVFVHLPEALIVHLQACGFTCSRWEGEHSTLLRFVTTYNTPLHAVEQFLDGVKEGVCSCL
jgi:threonine aldolase